MHATLTALSDGLGEVFSYPAFLYQLLGIFLGMLIGIIPGLGALFMMALALPFVFDMKTNDALALLVAIYATASTGGALTSILVGVPGTAVNVATVFDGYPMAQKGEGGRAVGAAMFASGAGGILGAVVLAALVPFLKPVVLAFGPAEFFMLALLAVVFIAFIGSGNMLKALVAGGLGLMLSFVGQQISTGTLRYTFGTLYLWNGIALVPAVLGLFAIGEMIDLAVRGGAITQGGIQPSGNVMQGVRDVFRHFWLFLRCSVIGIIIGIIPGIGGVVANFLTYGHAVQSSGDRSRFGKGAVEGVIAPQAGDNAKEGGSLMPTLLFGIPGSEAMALLLGGFDILGIEPGTKMLTEHMDMIFMLVGILVVSNAIGAFVGIAVARWVARITTISGSIIVPVVFAISLFGAYVANNSLGDMIVAIVFGIAGYYFKKLDYSRATLVIGLVLGKIVEKNLLLSLQLFGMRFLARPITAALLVLIIATMVYGLIFPVIRARKSHA
jgi:putative tricarboxylic transport membrane protein